MKIKAIIEFDSYEREFIIPCGTGDKTFKWLAIAASQRYSNAAPNGALRRRDEYCGISENAQYQVLEIVLPSGDSPHPAEMINYYLRDGDEVYITLGSQQPLEGLSHSPSKSEWTKLAFDNTFMGEGGEETTSPTKLKPSGSKASIQFDENAESFEVTNQKRKNLEAENLSKARFMVSVLKTQMLNEPKIVHFIKTEWAKVSNCLPKIQFQSQIEREKEHLEILRIYANYCDVLIELFKNYSPSGHLLKENFICFLEDAQVFSSSTLSEKANKIYDRVCKYVGMSNAINSFSLCHLLMAILLIAQSKYNDTLDSKEPSKKCVEAVSELFTTHFMPLARDLQLKCVLKTEFISNECLSRLRATYDPLHLLFDKCAAKTRDIPTTVPVADIHDILYQAGLTDDKSTSTFTSHIYEEVRTRGTIFGREAFFLEKDKDDEPLPSDEFTFPEFVEAIARAGFYRFGKKEDGNTLHVTSTSKPAEHNTGDEEAETESSVVDCMVRGATNVVESITNPNAHRKVATSKNAGGKSSGQNRKK